MEENAWKLKIFFDGACPICSREIRFLMRRNLNSNLAFEDTSNPNFNPLDYGISGDPNRVIHACLSDGRIVTGMEVFRRAYKEVGLGALLAPTGWPGLKIVFDALYLVFARNRKRFGNILGTACKLD